MNNITTYFKKINKDYTLITSFDSEPEPSYTLKLGEVVVYENLDPTSNEPSRCKVGDGVKTWNELEWFSDVSQVTAASNNMLAGTVAVNSEGQIEVGTISAGSLTLSSPTVDVFGKITTQSNVSSGYIENNINRTKTKTLTYDPKIVTYSVYTPGEITYGFTKNDLGYWESQNKGVNNSYALCRIQLTLEEKGSIFFDVINYAQSLYDYAIFSKLDTELERDQSKNDSYITYQAQFQGKSNSELQHVIYENVESGSHFIEVKFIKNATVSSNNDSVQFKIANGLELPIKSYTDVTISDFQQTNTGYTDKLPQNLDVIIPKGIYKEDTTIGINAPTFTLYLPETGNITLNNEILRQFKIESGRILRRGTYKIKPGTSQAEPPFDKYNYQDVYQVDFPRPDVQSSRTIGLYDNNVDRSALSFTNLGRYDPASTDNYLKIVYDTPLLTSISLHMSPQAFKTYYIDYDQTTTITENLSTYLVMHFANLGIGSYTAYFGTEPYVSIGPSAGVFTARKVVDDYGNIQQNVYLGNTINVSHDIVLPHTITTWIKQNSTFTELNADHNSNIIE